MAKIVLNTFGSFGDLHPFLALALELKRRGHRPFVATSAVYRDKIEGESIDFHPVRPDVGEFLDKPELLEKLWDSRRATQFLIRDYLAPQIRNSFEDLEARLRGCRFYSDALGRLCGTRRGPSARETLALGDSSTCCDVFFYRSAIRPGSALAGISFSSRAICISNPHEIA